MGIMRGDMMTSEGGIHQKSFLAHYLLKCSELSKSTFLFLLIEQFKCFIHKRLNRSISGVLLNHLSDEAFVDLVALDIHHRCPIVSS